jgi:peroxiredoxin
VGFDLPSLEGRNYSLDELLTAGPVLLVFFKISCPTCQLTLPYLERLYARGFPGAPQIVGISQDSARDTRDFNEHFGITFPMLIDSAGYPASNAYRVTNVPTLFLVDSQGAVTWSLNGFHKAELEALGERFGGSPFTATDRVPLLRPG